MTFEAVPSQYGHWGPTKDLGMIELDSRLEAVQKQSRRDLLRKVLQFRIVLGGTPEKRIETKDP